MPEGSPLPFHNFNFLPHYYSPQQPYTGFPQPGPGPSLSLGSSRQAIVMEAGTVDYNEELSAITLVLERRGDPYAPVMLLSEAAATKLIFYLQRSLAMMRGIPFPPDQPFPQE